jgi:hypothetical protein
VKLVGQVADPCRSFLVESVAGDSHNIERLHLRQNLVGLLLVHPAKSDRAAFAVTGDKLDRPQAVR